jgi:hypothetical protein
MRTPDAGRARRVRWSKRIEEREHTIGRSVATRMAAGRLNAVEGPLLEREIGVEIDLGAPLLLMAQPESDP